MYIANERNVTNDDLARYFGSCFVRDPETGAPGYVREITFDYVSLELVGGFIKTFEGSRAKPFASLDSYIYPRLGFRNTTHGLAYLERRAAGVGGRRGLSAATITTMRYDGFHVMHDISELLSIRFDPRSIDVADLARVVYDVPNISWTDALSRQLHRDDGLALSSSLALWPIYSPHRGSWAVLFHKTMIGRLTDGKIYVADASVIKNLGDTNGIDVVLT